MIRSLDCSLIAFVLDYLFKPKTTCLKHYRFLPVVESLGFGIKPGIHFVLGAKFLVDVAGFVNQV
jgi:hypothetical protein